MLFLTFIFSPQVITECWLVLPFFKRKPLIWVLTFLFFCVEVNPNVGLWSILQVLNIAPTNFDTFFQIQEPLKFV
jgi:hypothetical protein